MNDVTGAPTMFLTRPVGSNQVGMRQFNERIVLQAIRLHGALPKAEVARLTRLSTQTASVIINGLLEEGLVIKQDRLRGRIGQPSVPIALNPDGAFTLGIKVGRRSLDVLAMDFVGQGRYFLGAPLSVMDAWNEIDIHRRVQAMTSLPVEAAKDTTAAYVAELVAG